MAPAQNCCPKCGNARRQSMGSSSEDPTSSILRCTQCGHFWMKRDEGNATDAAPRECRLCHGARFRLVGRSAARVTYLRCESCDHLTIVPPQKPWRAA